MDPSPPLNLSANWRGAVHTQPSLRMYPHGDTLSVLAMKNTVLPGVLAKAWSPTLCPDSEEGIEMDLGQPVSFNFCPHLLLCGGSAGIISENLEMALPLHPQ